MRARQSKNRLLSVYNAEGDKFTDHKAVSQEAVSFFQHLFGGFGKRVGGEVFFISPFPSLLLLKGGRLKIMSFWLRNFL